LTGIAQAYDETLQARDAAEVLRSEWEEKLADVEARVTYIEDERREVINQAREQARKELELVRAQVAEMQEKLQTASVTLEGLEALEGETAVLEEKLAPEPTPAPPPPPSRRGERQPIRVGDTVWVEALNTSGQVTTLEGGEAEVQAGRLRLRLNTNELTWQPPPPELEPDDEPTSVLASGIPQSPGMEIDLRGMTTDEALPRVDKHIDSAALAGLPWVRIIHGHGTGALKRAVRDMLGRHPIVKSYEPGKPQEGGEGVTVAHLVNK
jgi:DNA mismatch repair protein MutS2